MHKRNTRARALGVSHALQRRLQTVVVLDSRPMPWPCRSVAIPQSCNPSCTGIGRNPYRLQVRQVKALDRRRGSQPSILQVTNVPGTYFRAAFWPVDMHTALRSIGHAICLKPKPC